METLCPFCANSVFSQTSFFCPNCGKKIRDSLDLDLHPSALKEEPAPPVSQVVSGHSVVERGKIFPIILVSTSLMLLLLSVFLRFGKNLNPLRSREIVSPVIVTQKPQSVDLSNADINLLSGEFSVNQFSQVSPADSSTFIALNNFSSFYQNYLEETKGVDFEKLFGLSMEESLSFIDNSFALILKGDSWAYLFKVKNKDFVSEKISAATTVKEGDLRFLLVGDILTVSKSESFLEDISLAQKGVSLSLSKDAAFLESLKDLPTEGEALVFFKDFGILKSKISEIIKVDLSNSLPANGAFVAKKSGVGVLLVF